MFWYCHTKQVFLTEEGEYRARGNGEHLVSWWYVWFLGMIWILRNYL